jgi:hypothetical protein
LGVTEAMDLDAKHNQAIRDEIADQLRALLSREPTTVPPQLRQLLWRLERPDDHHAATEASPSTVPAIATGLAGRAGGWLHRLLKRS